MLQQFYLQTLIVNARERALPAGLEREERVEAVLLPVGLPALEQRHRAGRVTAMRVHLANSPVEWQKIFYTLHIMSQSVLCTR